MAHLCLPFRFLAAALGLGLLGAASAQTVGGAAAITLRNPCDGRVDVTRLPSSATARHVITASGSYFLGRNVQCDPGQSAIEVAPSASSVVIDGNGFALLGDPGRTSPHAVHAPPAPAARLRLHLADVTAHTFASHLVRVEDVEQCRVQGGVFSDGDGGGMLLRTKGETTLGDVVVTKMLDRAVDLEETPSATLARCRISECGDGVRACTSSVQLVDCEVYDVDGDGLLFDDACAGPGVLAVRKAISTKGTGFNRCAGHGVRVVTTGPDPVDVTLRTTNLGHTGLDGVEVKIPPLPSSSRVLLEGCTIESSGGHGIEVDATLGPVLASAVVHDCNIGSSGQDGVSVRYTALKMGDVTLSDSQGHAVRVEDGSLECAASNIGSSGLDGVSLLRSSGKLYRSSVVGNAGLGVALRDASEGFFDRVAVCGNGLGGVLVEGAAGCAATTVRLSECQLVANGGVALDLRSAQGGEVRACTVSGSPTGIRVGDGSGLGCATGVRVSDNTVSQCASGVEVPDPGGHLVVRNHVTQCLSSFAVVTPGNLMGPLVVTDADLAASCSPHANYAP